MAQEELTDGNRTWVPEDATQSVNLKAQGWYPVATGAPKPASPKTEK